MGNAEELFGQPTDRTRVLPLFRRTGPAAEAAEPATAAPSQTGAFANPTVAGRIRYAQAGGPRVEPFCRASQGTALHHGGTGDDTELGLAWSAEFPVAAGRRNDLWVLVCGGIAAAAAFAAAFVASGGVASHPAAPNAVPAAVSRTCPSPAAGVAP
jgi:hypothetical protein